MARQSTTVVTSVVATVLVKFLTAVECRAYTAVRVVDFGVGVLWGCLGDSLHHD